MNHNNLRNIKGSPLQQKQTRKLCCYLRSKRNRIMKIAPIHEEPEDLSEAEGQDNSNTNCLKLTSCWQIKEQEVEVYQTKTKIYTSFPNTIDNRAKILKPTALPQPSEEEPQCLDSQKASDIPTISGSLLKPSLQYKVALHQYGSLHDSENKNDNILKKLEMANRTRHRKCLRLGSFYWLLKPFRGKNRKTEPKIQAVVYKTYFVKWTKPPDTFAHGYGVKSLRASSMGMSVLRRCRSALF